MRIRVVVPTANIDELRGKLLDGVDKLEHEEKGEEWSGVRKLSILFVNRNSHISIDDANRSGAVPGDFRAT
jgi:hypothetical protein